MGFFFNRKKKVNPNVKLRLTRDELSRLLAYERLHLLSDGESHTVKELADMAHCTPEVIVEDYKRILGNRG